MSTGHIGSGLNTQTLDFEESRHRARPLAHRMRPQTLDDFLGQEHLLSPGKPLRHAIERGATTSMVFWGPPGCGKTTLANLIAVHTNRAFEVFSAVTEGVPRVREIIREAVARSHERGTILFCDEIHRFNKAQQDAFLPSVEEGVITLIGATTENPSFELNSAHLSRMRVFVLQPLQAAHIKQLLTRAWNKLSAESYASSGEANHHVDPLQEDALELLAAHSAGDGRRALNTIEAVWDHYSAKGYLAEITRPAGLQAVLERRLPSYDKNGEQHFNIISALHKAVRGSDVEGALYWFARMIDAGEDPKYIARRIVRMACEDIGLADPRALTITLAAKDAYEFLGSPEGELAMVEAIIFLATAPKSNRSYTAWQQAQQAAKQYSDEPVPMHIRNAPTQLMKNIGYGAGYRYDHDEAGFAAGQSFLPDSLTGANWYQPTEHGFEKNIAARLEWWRERRAKGEQ
jgi:putative ATPase